MAHIVELDRIMSGAESVARSLVLDCKVGLSKSLLLVGSVIEDVLPNSSGNVKRQMTSSEMAAVTGLPTNILAIFK